MPLLGARELTLRKIMKMLEESFCTAHKDVNDENEDTRAWAELLNREGGEDENYGIHPTIGQTKTRTRSRRKSQVDNVVPSYTEMKLMVVKQVALTMGQFNAKRNPNACAGYIARHPCMSV